MLHGKFKKADKKLVHITLAGEKKYKEFVQSLPDDTMVEFFMEISNPDGSLAQLAKVHKCIRVLAAHSGHSFEEMKLYVKDKSGLLIIRTAMGNDYTEWKSFGDCSLEELQLAIIACIEIGDIVGLNLR